MHPLIRTYVCRVVGLTTQTSVKSVCSCVHQKPPPNYRELLEKTHNLLMVNSVRTPDILWPSLARTSPPTSVLSLYHASGSSWAATVFSRSVTDGESTRTLKPNKRLRPFLQTVAIVREGTASNFRLLHLPPVTWHSMLKWLPWLSSSDSSCYDDRPCCSVSKNHPQREIATEHWH